MCIRRIIKNGRSALELVQYLAENKIGPHDFVLDDETIFEVRTNCANVYITF